MRFFNFAKKLKVPAVVTAYAVTIPAIIYDEIETSKKIGKMIKDHPNARFESDEIMVRGQWFTHKHRMVDKETGAVVARCP
jgi:hypothetical protein